MGIVAVMTLALAAMSAERRRAEEQMHNLAVTDPLTGLANYRMLVDVLDGKSADSGARRDRSPCLLLDLDGLKGINDRYGHLTGSRALCDWRTFLRVHCRSIDTAARYGGDEFAMVIPEAELNDAQQVAHRIHERIARDTEAPPISVSIGAAVYPLDGETREVLLAAADRALYEVEAASTGEPAGAHAARAGRLIWRSAASNAELG